MASSERIVITSSNVNKVISGLPAPLFQSYGFLQDNNGTKMGLIQMLSSGVAQFYGMQSGTSYWGSIIYIMR